ncbi:MAG: hypothetical protein AB7N91_20015 [Candidatus Tectimicrobiota bacterium]
MPLLGSLSSAERAQLVRARTARVQTLTAVLAVSYTLATQRGAFDLVVNYAAPDRLRFTALKDTLLSTQILFDVLLSPEGYRLAVRDATGDHTTQGSLEQFVREHPTLRAFFLLGEAFFVPGVDGQGRPPLVNEAATRLHTQLRSGARARWSARPETLEITEACLRWQSAEDMVTLQLSYRDYRPIEEVYLPYRVYLSDRRLGFAAQSVVKAVDLNLPLVPGVFELTP